MPRVPPPSREYSRKWGLEIFSGIWKRGHDDETLEYRQILEISSSAPPAADDGRFHFLEEVNEGGGRYIWWEGKLSVIKDEKFTHIDLPSEDIAAHRAWSIWRDTYLHGFFSENLSPVRRAFLETADFAKTHYGSVSDRADYAYLTYSVKWYQREPLRQFIASLKRAFRIADRHGVDVRLMR